MLTSIIVPLRILIAKPLTNLLVKDVPFYFPEECLVAFIKLKEALISAPILHPPIWEEPFELICDISDYGVRVVLGQHLIRSPISSILIVTL